MDHTQYTTNGAERKPGTHLTMEDRGAIQAMKKLGYSNRAIARYLHCAPSTISNELKRGTPPRTGSRGRAPGYSAKRGDAVYNAIDNMSSMFYPHQSIILCVSNLSYNMFFPFSSSITTLSYASSMSFFSSLGSSFTNPTRPAFVSIALSNVHFWPT